MSVTIAEARPAYVTFQIRAEEDRAASVAAGHYVAKDVEYALITPMGSKDRIERIASEWFAKLAQDEREGRIPAEWVSLYRRKYEAWKEERELPEQGLAIESWPIATPAQIDMLRKLQVRTVEDLAAANEEVISRIGMGGRALKQRAVDWLNAASSAGKVAEQITALRAENDGLKARNSSLEAQLKELTAKVEALAAKV